MEKITFTPVEGEQSIEMFVLETTTLAGVDYLLVCDQPEGDADALILKDITGNDADERVYDIVADDDELDAVAKVFENILEDIEFTTEE